MSALNEALDGYIVALLCLRKRLLLPNPVDSYNAGRKDTGRGDTAYRPRAEVPHGSTGHALSLHLPAEGRPTRSSRTWCQRDSIAPPPMKYALVVLATLAALLLLALVFPYTGLYDVAADRGHSGFGAWYLNTTSTRSIETRAGGIAVPADLAAPAHVARGAVAFSQMCQTCHGAPGRERSVTGQGLTPTPPRLSKAATEWEPSEVYWILAHGIKMAGMPA